LHESQRTRKGAGERPRRGHWGGLWRGPLPGPGPGEKVGSPGRRQ